MTDEKKAPHCEITVDTSDWDRPRTPNEVAVELAEYVCSQKGMHSDRIRATAIYALSVLLDDFTEYGAGFTMVVDMPSKGTPSIVVKPERPIESIEINLKVGEV